VGNIAVLVDAGYLLIAAGELLAPDSVAGDGNRIRRHNIALGPEWAVMALVEAASIAEPAASLLRIYWYDAAYSPDRPTDEQLAIANMRNCKLRLGTLNAAEGQKGVDTLMVMDILALSRNGSVSSLLVVSGDDDLRPAIESAQEHGVRVHLLGVAPVNGKRNQNERLRRECDTVREWSVADVTDFISLQMPVPASEAAPDGPASGHLTVPRALADAVNHALEGASTAEIGDIATSSSENPSIPSHVHHRLLGRYGANLRRSVEEDEKVLMRKAFVDGAKAQFAARR